MKKKAAKKSKATKKKRVKNSDLADRLGEVLIEAAEHFNNNGDALEVSFPANCIRTLSSLYSRWPYLSQQRARTVACAIQLCDVNKFTQNCITVDLTAGAMWEWQNAIPVIAVIETLCREVALKEKLVKKSGRAEFKKVVNCLQSNGIIDHKLRDEIHKLRELRNNIHLYLQSRVGMATGKPKNYNRAVLTLEKLEKKLSQHYGF